LCFLFADQEVEVDHTLKIDTQEVHADPDSK